MTERWAWEYTVVYPNGAVEDGELQPFQPMTEKEVREQVRELYEIDPGDYREIKLRLINLKRFRRSYLIIKGAIKREDNGAVEQD